MSLALAEIRRAKVRFGLLVAAVALLVFLILFQQTLQNGLITAFVGAIRNQSAPVLVYSVDGRRTVQASVITPDAEARIRAVPGVGRAGRFGQGTFSVTAGGKLADAAIIGVPNERWGEVGMAIIVKKPGQTIEEGDVIRHCLGRLAKFKVPQAVQFVDVLPRNATGKVLKRELRTQYVGADKPAIT